MWRANTKELARRARKAPREGDPIRGVARRRDPLDRNVGPQTGVEGSSPSRRRTDSGGPLAQHRTGDLRADDSRADQRRRRRHDHARSGSAVDSDRPGAQRLAGETDAVGGLDRRGAQRDRGQACWPLR